MLKRFFSGLLISATAFACFSLAPASATNKPIIINNVLELCQAVMADGFWLDRSGTCDAYSDSQTSATIDRSIYTTSNLVLKDLNLTFTHSKSPFIIRSGGSITIDGGFYSSSNCVIWIQYYNDSNPAYYVPNTSIIINSGTFEASVTTKNSADSPSPVCLITSTPVTTDEAQKIIAGYLPAGKKFVNVASSLRATRATTDDIEIESGYAHVNKNEDVRDEVKYIKSTRVAVIGDTIPEPGPEPETEPEPVPEESEEESEEKTLPKAPRTGVK
ncbi:hypothetical protein IKG20_02850 [Candidatus Saccharibacteria bacterium]|nr:hypothetical protein [Candidatus Saccharibacteria bacterium]